MRDHIIETQELTLYYGKHRGIYKLNLRVKQGEVFGFLGPNGSGKTTTERILLDIIRPTKGKAYIFGLDCQKEGVKVRKRVGYLPGELSFYPKMTGQSFLDMLASFQENQIDHMYRNQLYERLNLDPSRKMKLLSKLFL